MTDWFVYDEAGAHRGPLNTEDILRAIGAGEIAGDVWVTEEAWFASPGAFGWRQPASVPELAAGLPSRSSRRPPLQIVQGAYTARLSGAPDFGATVMMMPEGDDGSG